MRLAIAWLVLVVAWLAACDGADPTVVLHPEHAPPDKLGDWGVVFAARGRLRVNDAAMPYALNTPLFSDYALKLRTIWMPPGTAAGWRDEGPFEFPVGTIISKTFYYPTDPAASDQSGDGASLVRKGADEAQAIRSLDLAQYRLIETRLLVRYDSGWKALPYVWDDAEQDAQLALAGDLARLRFADDAAGEFVYVVPDANQCAGCHVTDHSTRALQPIGPRAWQLNRVLAGAGGGAGQLEEWVAKDLLHGSPARYPAGIDWSARDEALANRARAYLDANCAHCHNDRGAADTSALDLRLGVPADRAFGVCKPPVAVGRGSGDRPYDIFPGRPQDSILLYRMQHTDPAIAMPELGRATAHAEAISLVSAWIATLPGSC